jgi:hypothetical protein
LDARIPSAIELLLELMQLHGREVRKDLPLPLDERAMGCLVLHEEPMMVSVLGDASIAQQRSHQNCLLELCQFTR